MFIYLCFLSLVMKVLFESALGGFALDGQKIVEQGDMKQLVKKYPDARIADETQSFRLLPLLKDSRYFTAFRYAHLRATLQSLRTMDVTDILITHAIQSVQEIDRSEEHRLNSSHSQISYAVFC